MHKNQSICAVGVAIAVIAIAGFAAAPGHAAEMRQSSSYLEQTILSLHKVRNSVVARHYPAAQKAVQAARSNAELEDIVTFVAYLDGRIYHYCRSLLLEGGPDSLEGLPCPVNPEGNLQEQVFDDVPDFSGQTSGEKLAQLDQELETALGEFDDMLLQEQERVAAHIPRQRESGGPGYDAGDDQPSGPDGGRPAGGGEAEEHQATGPGTEKSGSSAGGGHSSEGAGSGRTAESRLPPTQGPKDLSEADDDIVARQLREAAEQETDPEVKEKLWEEYRKYKEGIK